MLIDLFCAYTKPFIISIIALHYYWFVCCGSNGVRLDYMIDKEIQEIGWISLTTRDCHWNRLPLNRLLCEKIIVQLTTNSWAKRKFDRRKATHDTAVMGASQPMTWHEQREHSKFSEPNWVWAHTVQIYINYTDKVVRCWNGWNDATRLKIEIFLPKMIQEMRCSNLKYLSKFLSGSTVQIPCWRTRLKWIPSIDHFLVQLLRFTWALDTSFTRAKQKKKLEEVSFFTINARIFCANHFDCSPLTGRSMKMNTNSVHTDNMHW